MHLAKENLTKRLSNKLECLLQAEAASLALYLKVGVNRMLLHTGTYLPLFANIRMGLLWWSLTNTLAYFSKVYIS